MNDLTLFVISQAIANVIIMLFIMLIRNDILKAIKNKPTATLTFTEKEMSVGDEKVVNRKYKQNTSPF